MALLATNRFAGDGVTTSYEINFVGKYLDKSHVFAYVEDDVTGDRTPVTLAPANWLNDTTLQGLPVVPVGKTMVIYRNTPALPLVDFVDGAWLTPKALDTATRQGLFKAVESADGADGGGGGGGGPVVWADIQGKPYASATVPGIVKVGTGLTISPTGVLSASGGGGGGSPTGPAGGALSGSYPNPGLSSTVQNAIDSKADENHTHDLADIEAPSGSVSGHVVTYDGTGLVLAAPSGGGGGGGSPTGPAGGVLAGTYPNPDFRDPMPTMAQLLAYLQNFADYLHYHDTDALTQSGAAPGDVLTWINDTLGWKPAAPSVGSTKAFGHVKGLTNQTTKTVANTYTTVPLTSSGAVLVGGMGTQVDGLIVPRAGRYRVFARAMFTRDTTTACNALVTVYANGVRILDGASAFQTTGPANTSVVLACDGIITLSAGAGVEIRVFSTVANTMKDVIPELTTNFLQLEEI